jgi:uncharacterized protein YbjQ (UPF0145 family)
MSGTDERLDRIEELERQLAEAVEELEIWKSVFPDIAPRSVIPSTETMLAEARNEALEEAAKMADEWGDLSLAEAIRALKTEPRE